MCLGVFRGIKKCTPPTIARNAACEGAALRAIALDRFVPMRQGRTLATLARGGDTRELRELRGAPRVLREGFRVGLGGFRGGLEGFRGV